MSERKMYYCPVCDFETDLDIDGVPVCPVHKKSCIDEDEVNLNELSGSELVEKFLDDNSSNCENTIGRLNRLTKALGYGEQCYRNGSSLEEFLNDNSGCYDVIVEWIQNQCDNCEEWKESLRDVI